MKISIKIAFFCPSFAFEFQGWAYRITAAARVAVSAHALNRCRNFFQLLKQLIDSHDPFDESHVTGFHSNLAVLIFCHQ
jgi:hypothetical protein